MELYKFDNVVPLNSYYIVVTIMINFQYLLKHPLEAIEKDRAIKERIRSYEAHVLNDIMDGKQVNPSEASKKIDETYESMGFFGIRSHIAKVTSKEEIKLVHGRYPVKKDPVQLLMLPREQSVTQYV